jgi:hypothetical protein
MEVSAFFPSFCIPLRTFTPTCFENEELHEIPTTPGRKQAHIEQQIEPKTHGPLMLFGCYVI